MKTTAETIASKITDRYFDTDELVLSYNPPITAWANSEYESNYAEFDDGSFIDWNYKNEIEIG